MLGRWQASGSGGFKELACSPSTSSGQAVKEAMELFVARLMGTLDPTVRSREAGGGSSGGRQAVVCLGVVRWGETAAGVGSGPAGGPEWAPVRVRPVRCRWL